MLVLVLATFLFIAVAPDTSRAAAVLVFLQALTLAVALWTSGLNFRAELVPLAIIVLGVVGAIGQLLAPGDQPTGAFRILSMLFVASTCGVIARGVVRQGVVNARSVVGALSIYLMIGLFFTFAYGAVAGLSDSELFAQGTDGTPPDHLYYSYVTLTTVGYGDFSTSSDLGHVLSISESLLGQIYLVTVVALIVSRLRPRDQHHG